jgi:hypothetical protein
MTYGMGRAAAALKEEAMSLRFIGIDPNTPNAGCPSVWVDEVTGDLVFQGSEELDGANRTLIDARSPMLPGERIIRIPNRMRHIVREALEDTA